MNIYVENNYKYHYEIIASVFTILFKKIGIDEDCTIYLKCVENTSFKQYVLNNFSNVVFVLKKPLISFSHYIWCTVYPSNLKDISDKPNHWYISHESSSSLAEKENVFFLTPLCGVSRWFLPTVLPPIHKEKTSVPTFIIQGNVSEKRRNYASLIQIFETFFSKQFKVKLVGKGTLPDYLIPYKEKIIFRDNLNFMEFHKEFSDVDYLLPLIDDDFHHYYFTNKLTSNISYAVAYNIPLLCHKKFVDIYDLKNATTYTNLEEFIEQFGNCLQNYISSPRIYPFIVDCYE